ncbi:MAG TPA: nickel pincer cofactor biosynthesis protein LarC [Vicinamibacterales bacterium]
MSRVLYFDCFSGISGDMTLGALLDAGLPLEELKRALGSLALGDAHVHVDRVLRTGLSATKFSVHEHKHSGESHEHAAGSHAHGTASHQHGAGSHGHRTLTEIFALIDRAALSTSARERAKTMFQRLGEVEASIHSIPVEQIHLHEVGSLDSIIDIAGVAFAMEWVGAERIVCSPLNVGGGTVDSAHGRFPVPAPATVKLLGGAAIYSGDIQKELVTPTGALIVTTYASAFGPIPPMKVDRVGYGAGDRDDPKTPNVLRVLIGESMEARTESASGPGDRVVVVECEIDDMNPQIFGSAMEQLYAAGALEVFYVPVQMKKNRPGTLLTVIAPIDRRSAIADVVFRETTTIGLRYFDVARECLKRESVTVETPVGAVRFKIAWRDGKVVNAAPEFEDVARLAATNKLPVKDVQAIAIRAFADVGRGL